MNERTIETRQDWNQGNFENTSSDRDENSGNLGIGYVDGDFPSERTEQILDGLVAFWRLDEDYGTSSSNDAVSDYSGNNIDGTTEDGLDTTDNGIFGTNGYNFNDSNEPHVVIPHDDSISGANFTDALTICLWVKFEDFTAPDEGRHWLITKYGEDDPTDNPDEYWIELEDLLNFQHNDEDDFQSTKLENHPITSENEWYFITATVPLVDGEKGEFFINGEDFDDADYVEEGRDITSILGNNERVEIGKAKHATGRWTGGVISSVMIFDKHFSLEDHRQLYFDGHLNDNFTGTWGYIVVDEEEEVEWTNIDFTNHDFTIPTGDEIDCIVRSLDDQENVNDSKTLNLSEGTDVYDISDLANGHKLEVEFDMTVNQ